jgi:hypothetical protein
MTEKNPRKKAKAAPEENPATNARDRPQMEGEPQWPGQASPKKLEEVALCKSSPTSTQRDRLEPIQLLRGFKFHDIHLTSQYYIILYYII